MIEKRDRLGYVLACDDCVRDVFKDRPNFDSPFFRGAEFDRLVDIPINILEAQGHSSRPQSISLLLRRFIFNWWSSADNPLGSRSLVPKQEG